MILSVDSTHRARPLVFVTYDGRLAWVQDGLLWVFSRARWAWERQSDPTGRYAGRMLRPVEVQAVIATLGTPARQPSRELADA